MLHYCSNYDMGQYNLQAESEMHNITKVEREHTDKRCWFNPPFASIIRKPFDSGNSLDPSSRKTLLAISCFQ